MILKATAVVVLVLVIVTVCVLAGQTTYTGAVVATVEGEPSRTIVHIDDQTKLYAEIGPAPKPGPCLISQFGSPRVRFTPGMSSLHFCGADGVWIRVAGKKTW